MDEAKSLVMMAIQAIFAALILSAAVGLITLGYTMWRYFARQDQANSQMATYSEYAAYDNTLLRGQEVVELLSRTTREKDLFVLIFDDSNSAVHATVDAIQPDKLLAYSKGKSSWVNDYNLSNIPVPTSGGLTQRILAKARSLGKPVKSLGSEATDLTTKTNTELIKIFTTSMNPGDGGCYLGQIAKDAEGHPIESGAYAPFYSCIVYADDSTNDAAGIVLVRSKDYVVVE